MDEPNEEQLHDAKYAADLIEAANLINRGEASEALRTAEQVITGVLSPTVLSVAWRLKSRALLELGRLQDAVAAAEVAVAADPSSARAYGQLARVCDAMHRYDETLSAATHAIEVDQDNALAWTFKARALHALARDADALVAIEHALALDPTSGAAWSTKGAALFKLARCAEAVVAYDESLRPDLDHPLDNPKEIAGILETKAHALGELGRWDESLAAAEAAQQLEPASASALGTVGLARVQLERFAEALPTFEEMTALYPELRFGWWGLGAALHGLERLEEALAAYDRALSLDPDYGEARRLRSEVLAQLIVTGHFPPSIERASEPMLRNPDLWLNIAKYYHDLKRRSEAAAACEEVIALNPDDPSGYLAKFATLRATLRWREALAAYLKYLQVVVRNSWQNAANGNQSQ